MPVWKAGRALDPIERASAEAQGLLLLDLGEDWTPYIFSEVPRPRDPADAADPTETAQAAAAAVEPSTTPPPELLPSAYRETYLALARGEFPEDRHGRRAEDDKYLELYGILPTLTLLRSRFEETQGLACTADLDLQTLRDFDGFVSYRNPRHAQVRLNRYNSLKQQTAEIAQRLGLPSFEQISEDQVETAEWQLIQEYASLKPEIEAVAAAQARLQCEGFFEGRRAWTPGLFDWYTHEALAEFERRHRVYGWGFVGKDTLLALREQPAEIERQAVIRALTERAMHAAAVIEDGSIPPLESGEPRTYRNAAGEEQPIPNLEEELRRNIIEAFGLQTPESTFAWLKSLGDISAKQVVAIRGVKRPEYYSDSMDLSVTVDRGDVWYEFPFDEEGKSRHQPVSRRPRITLFTTYNGQKIPLARFGTTIGGWRTEVVDGRPFWKYKGSPVGARVWSHISAAPVWVPPESTPPRAILSRQRGGGYSVNYHETGPSYASAYGLVAAYHRKYWNGPNGIEIGGDEGIRTHGSVDYMSIMRRYSHGCHRMHNHLAVRLMSFVLQHRPHERLGQQPMDYLREFEYEDNTYTLEFDHGGYIFQLEEPLHVDVLPGRIRGRQPEPIEHLLPKYDEEQDAYVMTDGLWVNVDRFGNITYRPKPIDPETALASSTGVATNQGAAPSTGAVPSGTGTAAGGAPPSTTAVTTVGGSAPAGTGVPQPDPFEARQEPVLVPGQPVAPYIPEKEREKLEAEAVTEPLGADAKPLPSSAAESPERPL